MATEFTTANFADQVLASDKPVLVDFWRHGAARVKWSVRSSKNWRANSTTLAIGKVNVDDNQELAQQYGIASIPTMLLFKNGEIAAKTMGFQPEPQLRKSSKKTPNKRFL